MASPTPPAPLSPQVLYMTPTHRVTKARYVTSSDPRGYVPVYEYPLNGQWIMMDTDDGYVLWTGIWKALGNSKADIVKILESHPDLASKLRRVRGGYLKMQGTWMARDVALELARRVAWNIRYDLVPLFGPSFPDSCLSPDQPGYGKVVTKPPPKTRKPKKSTSSNQPSSPQAQPTSLPSSYPHTHDSPVSPITTDPSLRAHDYFESPVESNLSIPPERVFDYGEAEGGGGYARRGERQTSGEMQQQQQQQFGNQAGWSLGVSGAAIKEEQQPGLYDYPRSQQGMQGGRYESYAYPSTESPTHVRRGSISHMSSYPTSPSSSTYSYPEGIVKHERSATGDSGYGFSPIESYTQSGGIDMSQSGQYHQQYAPQPAYQSQEYTSATPSSSQHERSRSDSRYAPYQTASSIGYTLPDQGYVSAPPSASARGMGFPVQGQSGEGAGGGYQVDQYPHMSSPQQQQHMSPQMSAQHMAQGAQQYAGYEYGYAGYAGNDQSGLRLNLAEQQQQQQRSEEREAQYQQYRNQY